MTAHAPPHPVVRFLRLHHVELLTVLTILFVLQTGLVPFDFGRVDAAKGPAECFTTATTHLTLPDVISNIFLYVPVGVFLQWFLLRATGLPIMMLPATILLAVAMSTGVEWLQAYSATRVSSLIDVCSNGVGATIGALLSSTARWLVPRMVGAALLEFHDRPHAAALKAYCMALIVFAAIPFSFSFDVGRLKTCVRSANFVPFSAETVRQSPSDVAGAKSDHHAYARLKWLRMKRWSRWAAECASFTVLAWLMHTLLASDYGFDRRTTFLLLLWMGGLFAVALSVLQLPIISRVCDVTDVIFRVMGLGLGLLTRAAYSSRYSRLSADHRDEWTRGLARAGCYAVSIYILYTGLIPLTFDAGSTGPAESIASESFLPFFAYFFARFDLMMADVMEKFVSYMLFAVLLSTCWPRVAGLDARPRLGPVLTLGLLMSLVIELAQMFIPVRVTSLTDPILAGIACLVGVLAQRHAATFLRFAATQPMLRPQMPAQTPGPGSPMDPMDVLMAGLMDEKPNAPREPSPTRAPTRGS